MSSSAQCSSTTEKNLVFTSKHHMLQTDKKTTTIKCYLLTVIWKEILISTEKVGSDSKTSRKTLDSDDFHVKVVIPDR